MELRGLKSYRNQKYVEKLKFKNLPEKERIKQILGEILDDFYLNNRELGDILYRDKIMVESRYDPKEGFYLLFYSIVNINSENFKEKLKLIFRFIVYLLKKLLNMIVHPTYIQELYKATNLIITLSTEVTGEVQGCCSVSIHNAKKHNTKLIRSQGESRPRIRSPT